jgi:hypothetical protein
MNRRFVATALALSAALGVTGLVVGSLSAQPGRGPGTLPTAFPAVGAPTLTGTAAAAAEIHRKTRPAAARLLALAKQGYGESLGAYKSGLGTLDAVHGWIGRIEHADLDNPRYADDSYARLRELEAAARGRVTAGTAPTSELTAAQYLVAEAELSQAYARAR